MARIAFRNLQSVLRGAFISLAGCFLLLKPGITMQSVMMVIGGMLVLSGVITLFLSNRTIKIRGFFSLQGLLNVLIGLTFLAAPTVMLKFFVVSLGIMLLLIGAFQLIGSTALFSFRGWSFFYFLIALLLLSGGFLLLLNPFKSMETIVSFIGILMILYGLSQMISGRLSKKKEYYKGLPVEDIPYEEL